MSSKFDINSPLYDKYFNKWNCICI